jgi:hypothetical protein
MPNWLDELTKDESAGTRLLLHWVWSWSAVTKITFVLLYGGMLAMLAAGCLPASNPPVAQPHTHEELVNPETLVVVVAAAVEQHENRHHAETPDTVIVDPDTTIVDPPDPPVIGDSGLAGEDELSDCWKNWMGRHRMGEKFGCGDGYAWMGNNTNAGMKIAGKGNKGWLSGWMECEIYYDTSIHPGQGGGQHVLGIMSQAASRAGAYDPDPDLDHTVGDGDPFEGWIRLDFGVRENKLNAVVYEGDGHGTKEVGTIPFVAWNEWATLRVEWEQDDSRVRFKINGRQMSYTHHGGRNPIGNLIFVGNMDRNYGERCRGDDDPCGLLGKVRYRNVRVGRD